MFFARLDSLLYIGRQDFEDYFGQAIKIVTEEFESFKGFNESQQREVAEVLFGKNVSYHALIPYFDSLDVRNGHRVWGNSGETPGAKATRANF